ncbi:hypothetical protein DM860_002230 [Cuscuta australis]|uniref:SWIM-type domain-containing protein n=1 Tax=Cuscuta australis TaxID=267555 RepID=A0A328E008_9ASTE|nr:hypothetical protein DM860_002230 [Cuscuta australis]
MEGTSRTFPYTIKFVGLLGSHSLGRNLKFMATAVDLGRELVRQKIRLTYGGGNVALQGAVASTVYTIGGIVRGFIPGYLAAGKVYGPTYGAEYTVSSNYYKYFEMNHVVEAFIILLGGVDTMEGFLAEELRCKFWMVNKRRCETGYFRYEHFRAHRLALGYLDRERFHDSFYNNRNSFVRILDELTTDLQDIGFPAMYGPYPSLVSQFSFSFEANGHLPIDGYKHPIAGWEVDFQTRKESTLNDLQRSCLPSDGYAFPSLGSHRWLCLPIAGFPSMGKGSHRWVECEKYLQMLDEQDHRICAYLSQIGQTRWARCKSGPYRHFVMTNAAESMNNVNNSAREYPICKLVYFIREMMQKWFHERFETASFTSTILPKKLESELITLQRDAFEMKVKPAWPYEFKIVDGWTQSFVVKLRDKSCTCGDFQLDHFVCVHALAAIGSRPGLSCYNFISPYYKREALVATYSGIVHPLGDKSTWDIPTDVKTMVCKPPSCNKCPLGGQRRGGYHPLVNFTPAKVGKNKSAPGA